MRRRHMTKAGTFLSFCIMSFVAGIHWQLGSKHTSGEHAMAADQCAICPPDAAVCLPGQELVHAS